MNLKSSNKVETNRYELDIEVTPEELNKAIDKAYNRQKNKLSVPGFRKGKAPRKFIEKYYGESVFYEDAINILYPDAISMAEKEGNLEIIDDKVDFDLVKISKEEGLNFKVKVTVMPEVEIGDYKSIKIKKQEPIEITEENIQEELERVREQNARLINCEENSTVENNDVVTINFEGKVDGKEFAGGTAENFELTIGSGQFIPGFEEQIIGHKINEEFDISVKFPDEYHVKSLAGKDSVFTIKLKNIQKKELPELDDEFVKDISEYNTIEEYKNSLKEILEKEQTQNIESQRHEELYKNLVELVKVELPEALINHEIQNCLKAMDRRLQQQNLNLKLYMDCLGLTQQDMYDNYRDQAIENLKHDLALKKIMELENIEITDEELEQEYNKMSESVKVPVERLKKLVKPESYIIELKYNKTRKFIENIAFN